MSEAVTVWLGADLNVTLSVLAPDTRGALAGRTALVSLDESVIVSVTLVILFQFASTALTVTLKAVPAVWPLGVPVLPLEVPGAALSPGARSCNLLNAAAL